MRTGQVWPNGNEAQDETPPAESRPDEVAEVARTAEVADFAAPPAEGNPPVSPPALFQPGTASVPARVRAAALADVLCRVDPPEILTNASVNSADELEGDPVYRWQPGLVLSLVMLGGLVTYPRDRSRDRIAVGRGQA